jgi:hypothetical protein
MISHSSSRICHLWNQLIVKYRQQHVMYLFILRSKHIKDILPLECSLQFNDKGKCQMNMIPVLPQAQGKGITPPRPPEHHRTTCYPTFNPQDRPKFSLMFSKTSTLHAHKEQDEGHIWFVSWSLEQPYCKDYACHQQAVRLIHRFVALIESEDTSKKSNDFKTSFVYNPHSPVFMLVLLPNKYLGSICQQ